MVRLIKGDCARCVARSYLSRFSGGKDVLEDSRILFGLGGGPVTTQREQNEPVFWSYLQSCRMLQDLGLRESCPA